jgi:hypothetical protein
MNPEENVDDIESLISKRFKGSIEDIKQAIDGEISPEYLNKLRLIQINSYFLKKI